MSGTLGWTKKVASFFLVQSDQDVFANWFELVRILWGADAANFSSSGRCDLRFPIRSFDEEPLVWTLIERVSIAGTDLAASREVTVRSNPPLRPTLLLLANL